MRGLFLRADRREQMRSTDGWVFHPSSAPCGGTFSLKGRRNALVEDASPRQLCESDSRRSQRDGNFVRKAIQGWRTAFGHTYVEEHLAFRRQDFQSNSVERDV
jgi:hypothetical protein